MSENKKAPGQRGVNDGKGQSKYNEFSLIAEKTIIPNCLILTVLNPDGSELGIAYITLAQWEDQSRLKNIVIDMKTMEQKGIGMAFIQEREAQDGK